MHKSGGVHVLMGALERRVAPDSLPGLLQEGAAAWAGARAAGSKFVYLRNAAALLELALCSWALQRAAAAGFTPTTTPDLVRESLLEKCGFQPRGDTTQVRPGRALGFQGQNQAHL